MIKLITSMTVIFLLFDYSFAQAPDTLWTRTFGGVDYDDGWLVQQTTDGGYIIVGRTQSFGPGSDYDIYLIKTDEKGDTLWTKVFNEYSTQAGHSVQQTTDGGYIVTGLSAESGNSDVYLIKTDVSGNAIWTKTYGGSNNGYGRSAQQTTDGGYIIVGYIRFFGSSDLDVWLIRTDENGDTLWTKTFDRDGIEYGYSVKQTTDDGFVIGASTFPFGGSNRDLYLIKTDENGDTLWTRTYGGSNREDGGYCQQTKDGGYIILGITASFGEGGLDLYLIKTDVNGDTLWTRTYGGTGFDWGFAIQQTLDSGYIITGRTDSYGAGGDDVWIIKTDEIGDTIWTKTLGGGGNESGESIQQTFDGEYVITGRTESFGAGDYDVWLIKLEPDSVVNVNDEVILFNYSLTQNYPNPFNPSTSIKFSLPSLGYASLKIYNALGQEVAVLLDKELTAGTYEIEWDASAIGGGFTSGVYFYQLKTDGYVETKKMVLLK